MRLVSATEFRRRLELLETWLWNDAVVALDLPSLSVHALAQRVVELSDLYTLERDLLETVSLRRGHFLARLLYFLCSDAPKLFLVLEELSRRGELAGAVGRRVVDLGCGLGASAAGLLLAMDSSGDGVAPAQGRQPTGPGQTAEPLRLLGVDRDPQALAAWQAVVGRCAEIAGVSVLAETREADLREIDPDPAIDLLLCQTAINECLEPPSRAGDVPRYDDAMVERIGRWSRRATTILIEPALRITTRPLHDLRDRVLAWSRAGDPDRPGPAGSGEVRVLAPCPHQRACPMLAAPRDWCHETRWWQPTARAAEIQRLTRRRDDRAKFAFVVFGPAAEVGLSPTDAIVPAITVGPDARVVSDPLATKGKVERFLCTSSGALRRLRLLDRERTPANELIATARRGELVSIEAPSERDRVDPTARVARWAP